MRLEEDFAELLALFNAHEVRYCIVGAVEVPFISRDDLVKSKSSTGRPQDVVDIEHLKNAREQ